MSWRIPSTPTRVYTRVAVPAYSLPDISSQFVDVIPPQISLQVIRLTEGWYQVTWLDRDHRLRWIEASRVTTPPPKEAQPSSQVAVPSVAGPPLTPTTRTAVAEEIPLARVSGVYEIPVEINGVLTLNFVLDSGASEVHMPADVVLTLVRTGTIKARISSLEKRMSLPMALN
jgi:hypothetical protein